MITKTDLPALAAGVLAVAGADVGGLWLRARVGDARAAYLDSLHTHLPEISRISPEMDDVTLYGGVDVAASLAEGRRVRAEGLLARPGRLTLVGAERASPAFSARLAGHFDSGTSVAVAIDEGVDADEAPALAVTSRLGLFVTLDEIRAIDLTPCPKVGDVEAARARYAKTTISGELVTELVTVAELYGVTDLRLNVFARAAAKAVAALDDRGTVTDADVARALALVIVPRGHMPDIADQEPAPDPQEPAQPTDSTPDERGPKDVTRETIDAAVKVVLPEGLQALAGAAPRPAAAIGDGAARASYLRGRPLPPRAGPLGSGRRIDPVASIRAALPWQRLRTSPPGQRLALRKSDLRLRRYENRTQRVIIFAVDASGSQAVARMAEAKGAVECLLAEAYRSRDEVALIAFRKTEAEVLLPPTRALVRARSALSALPGGGGTPLAAGLLAASNLAETTKKAGATPVIVLLSDGRANVTLAGHGGRAQAQRDANTVASAINAKHLNTLVLDTARRPEPMLADLAHSMGGRYIALPNADARVLSAAVCDALDT